MNDKQLELIHNGVMAGLGDSYPSYKSCIRAAFVAYYNEIDPKYIAEIDYGDYEGDTFGLVQSGHYENGQPKTYYYFNYGWGSCSGCDMLEGSGPIETIKSLRRSIVPIPGSITEYLKKEITSTWDKQALNELLEKWEQFKANNRLDDYGKRI